MMRFISILVVMIFSAVGLQAQNNNNFKGKEMNETIKTIFERKSVRSFYKDRIISKDTLELIVKAAMAAPTARNIQPWEFIIIDDKQTMLQLAEDLPYAKMLREASAAIIICGYPEESGKERASRNWMLDCAAATQNLLLAVESLNLGAVWTAGWPYPERIEAIRKATSLPDYLLPLNVIPIGYPTGMDKPKDKFKKDRIHWNKFQSKE